MLVQDIMTPNPITIDPSKSISDALLLMYQHEIRHLPVVEGRRLVGIVSDRDIKQTMGPPSFAKGPLDEVEAALPVTKIMTRNAIAVQPENNLKVAIREMVDNRISCLPVVDHGTNLVGIVSEIDILGYCLDLLEQTKES